MCMANAYVHQFLSILSLPLCFYTLRINILCTSIVVVFGREIVAKEL